ncbi:MAG: A/G-specific adenine glycosylase [Kiloniellales bacterium]
MTENTPDPAAAAKIADSPAGHLLAWYRAHARALPWRALPGAAADPYAVWLSEIMLQQTTVASVAPYFRTFLARWPRVEDLAEAPLDAVLSAWAGLGYYARARNLHACARAVCAEHGGRFPDTEAGLRALPGIGPYTAAAVAAIAFGRRAAPVDGNVERVTARYFAVAAPLPGAKAELRRRAEDLLPEESERGFPYGDLAQALMDLGATVCLPAQPRCGSCPLAADCRGRANGLAAELPRRAPRRARPLRRGVAFWLTRADGAVLLRRRAEAGLLGGMMEVPSTEWREAPWSAEEAGAQAPVVAPGSAPGAATWRPLPGVVRHGFTHFRLELEVWIAPALGDPPGDASGDAPGGAAPATGRWVRPEELDAAGLPTLMRKVARHALAAG